MDDQTNDDICTTQEHDQSEDDDDSDSEMVGKEKTVPANLEHIQHNSIKAGKIREICKVKTRLSIKTKYLPGENE